MKKLIYSAALTLTLALAACSDSADYSPQEILNEAMQQTSDVTSYYGEYFIQMESEADGDSLLEAKQWSKDEKIRIEMTDNNGNGSIAVNDGLKLISYDEQSNTAISLDLSNEDENLGNQSMQQQALSMLELVKDTHTISIGEDAKIAGHDTYHLIAKTNDDNSLLGDMEVWVDKKTWMILKTTSTSGDMVMVSEYTVFEPNAKIDDAQFEPNLPEGVEIEEMTYEGPAIIALEEAQQKLGQFLQVPEQLGYELMNIGFYDSTDTNEISLNYGKGGVQHFSVSVFKPLAPVDSQEEQIDVRGMKGTKMELNTFKMIQWEENGLRYNIIIENNDLTIEDAIDIANAME